MIYVRPTCFKARKTGTLQFASYIRHFITKKVILVDMLHEILGVDETIYGKVIFVSPRYHYATNSQGLREINGQYLYPQFYMGYNYSSLP